MSSNLGEMLVTMAKEIWGEPTSTTAHIVRFKKSKGVAINTTDGTWFDFTENQGGGVVDFIETHFSSEPKAQVFKRFGGSDFLNGLWEGTLLLEQ